MRWMVLVVLALLAAGSAQALSHDDGQMGNTSDQNGDDVDVDVENDNNGETVGAGRDGDHDAISTPWAIVLVLGALVVIAVVAALLLAGRERHP